MAEHVEAHFIAKHGYGTRRILDIMHRVNDRLCSIHHNNSDNLIALDNLFYDFYHFERYCADATTTGDKQTSWNGADFALASMLRLSSPKFPPW
eukprot:7815326-Karenia_brevis.AAC.1